MLASFEVLKKVSIKVNFNTYIVLQEALERLRDTYDAVYVGTGKASAQELGIETEISGPAIIDPVTFETSLSGIFTGGSAVYEMENHSPITSISHGRRAAISIDRFLQKVSLSASRENEGAYEALLFTSTEGIQPLPRIGMDDPAQGYSSEAAALEAARCLQCQCMECVKICEYLAHFKGFQEIYKTNLQ